MSRIAEWLKKAENLARGHSKQADQVLDRAEQFAKERTGHKYDQHIEKGADTVQRRYGGGQGQPQGGEQQPPGQAAPGQGQPGQGQQPPGQVPPEQGR